MIEPRHKSEILAAASLAGYVTGLVEAGVIAGTHAGNLKDRLNAYYREAGLNIPFPQIIIEEKAA
jgi:hypothetical protein